jgi:hypothetical protein
MRRTSRRRAEPNLPRPHARLAAGLAASALAAVALASCGPKPDANAASGPTSAAPTQPATPAPDIAADTAAAAQTPKDQPNFRVCLSNSLDQTDGAPLIVPAGVIFGSWGVKKGDERNPSLDANMLAPDAIRYVVVLDRPVTLSKSTPCAETVAQAALSAIYEWKLPLVRNSQNLQFQVAGVENHMAFPLTDRLGGLVKKGLIFGFPTANIGNPRALRTDED